MIWRGWLINLITTVNHLKVYATHSSYVIWFFIFCNIILGYLETSMFFSSFEEFQCLFVPPFNKTILFFTIEFYGLLILWRLFNFYYVYFFLVLKFHSFIHRLKIFHSLLRLCVCNCTIPLIY